MVTEAAMIEQLAVKIVEKMGPFIEETINKTVHEEVMRALQKAMTDSDFYKGLSDDVINGVERIYQEISAVKKDVTLDKELEKAFTTIGQSESILDNVLEITESSTLKIMDIIEAVQEKIKKAKNLISTEEFLTLCRELDQDLLDMVTLLSFQDITGQKIKKLIDSLKKIEQIAFELYLSSETFIKAKEEGIEKDYLTLRDTIKQKVASAKPQKESIDQSDIDAILSSLNQ